MERLEYRHAITKQFFSWCQSLLTTLHANVPPELIDMSRTSPTLGMWSMSICLLNLTSSFPIVFAGFTPAATRSDGILRLISTVCGIDVQQLLGCHEPGSDVNRNPFEPVEHGLHRRAHD